MNAMTRNDQVWQEFLYDYFAMTPSCGERESISKIKQLELATFVILQRLFWLMQLASLEILFM